MVVRKSDAGPRARVFRGDGEPHVIGLGRVRPDDVVLALARGNVAAFRCRPLAVTIAGRRRRHHRLLLAGRRFVIVVRRLRIRRGFRRLLLTVRLRRLLGIV